MAALLTACGGSSSSSSTSTAAEGSGTTTSGATAQGNGSAPPEQAGNPSGGNKGGHSRGGQGSGSGSGSKDVAAPLKVSGGGSAQFRTKGGDNSIQEFGGEGGESELQEVAELVHGFYVARAREEWDRACSYLAKSNVEQLEQLASQAPQLKGAGCGSVLKAFTRPLPASVDREITTVDAGSFRQEGSEGFLIYYGAGHTAYAMPLRQEGGAWKVAALSGTTLG